MRLCLHKIFPAVFRILEAREERVSLEDELIFIEEKFSSYPNISIDYGLLDNNEDVCVMESDFGWADLGMWHSIYDTKKKVEGDNVVIDTDVILEECKGNIIKLPKGRLGVIQGLEGYIIAEQGNVLLICKKGDSSALIRKYVNDVKLNHGEEYV
jgi:mannose-1-phosphate guanylyltransferase